MKFKCFIISITLFTTLFAQNEGNPIGVAFPYENIHTVFEDGCAVVDYNTTQKVFLSLANKGKLLVYDLNSSPPTYKTLKIFNNGRATENSTTAIMPSGSYVYGGTFSTKTPYVFKINAAVSNPTFNDTCQVDYNENIRALMSPVEYNGKIYLGTFHSDGPDMKIVEVDKNNINTMTILKFHDAQNPNTNFNRLSSLCFAGNYLYVGTYNGKLIRIPKTSLNNSGSIPSNNIKDIHGSYDCNIILRLRYVNGVLVGIMNNSNVIFRVKNPNASSISIEKSSTHGITYRIEQVGTELYFNGGAEKFVNVAAETDWTKSIPTGMASVINVLRGGAHTNYLIGQDTEYKKINPEYVKILVSNFSDSTINDIILGPLADSDYGYKYLSMLVDGNTIFNGTYWATHLTKINNPLSNPTIELFPNNDEDIIFQADAIYKDQNTYYFGRYGGSRRGYLVVSDGTNYSPSVQLPNSYPFGIRITSFTGNGNAGKVYFTTSTSNSGPNQQAYIGFYDGSISSSPILTLDNTSYAGCLKRSGDTLYFITINPNKLFSFNINTKDTTTSDLLNFSSVFMKPVMDLVSDHIFIGNEYRNPTDYSAEKSYFGELRRYSTTSLTAGNEKFKKVVLPENNAEFSSPSSWLAENDYFRKVHSVTKTQDGDIAVGTANHIYIYTSNLQLRKLFQVEEVDEIIEVHNLEITRSNSSDKNIYIGGSNGVAYWINLGNTLWPAKDVLFSWSHYTDGFGGSSSGLVDNWGSNNFNIDKIDLIKSGDFNNDGYDDLFITRKNQYSILYGDRWANSNETKIGFFNAWTDDNYSIDNVATGDFNGDGFKDIAISCYNINLSTKQLIKILWGQKGKSQLTDWDAPLWGASLNAPIEHLKASDINADGYDDLIISRNDNIDVMFGTNDLQLSDNFYDYDYSGTINYTIKNIVVCDFDGDDFKDIFFNLNYSDFIYRLKYVPESPNGPTFSLVESLNYNIYSGSEIDYLACGDLNADGLEDLVINVNKTIDLIKGNIISLNNGNSFPAKYCPSYLTNMLVGDVTGDRFEDILCFYGKTCYQFFGASNYINSTKITTWSDTPNFENVEFGHFNWIGDGAKSEGSPLNKISNILN